MHRDDQDEDDGGGDDDLNDSAAAVVMNDLRAKLQCNGRVLADTAATGNAAIKDGVTAV